MSTMTYNKKEVKKLLHEQRKKCAETFGKTSSSATHAETLQAIHKTPLVSISSND